MLVTNDKQLVTFLSQQKGRVLITGFSGAGKSFSKHLLEKAGLEVEDIDHFAMHVQIRTGEPQWICAPDLLTSRRFVVGTCSNIDYVVERWKPQHVVLQQLEHSLFQKVMMQKASKKELPEKWRKSFLERANWTKSQYDREFQKRVARFRAMAVTGKFHVHTVQIAEFEGVPLMGWFQANSADTWPKEKIWYSGDTKTASFTATEYNTPSELATFDLKRVFVNGGGGRVYPALDVAVLLHHLQVDVIIHNPVSAGGYYAMLRKAETRGMYSLHGFSGGYQVNNEFWADDVRVKLVYYQNKWSCFDETRFSNYISYMDIFQNMMLRLAWYKPASIWLHVDLDAPMLPKQQVEQTIARLVQQERGREDFKDRD